jgi:predicted dehydrogenase
MLRAAVIGCGVMGTESPGDPAKVGVDTHAEAYRRCEATELVALCDRRPEQVARWGERLDVAARYTDAAALLAEQRPHLVSVCTPDDTHFELAMLALESPGVRGVFVEKPLARTPSEARELVELAERGGVALAVNYLRRHAAGVRRVKDEIASGALGRIQAVTGVYTKGVLRNGTHWLDLARFLVGGVERVRARFAGDPDAADPELHAQIEFAGGTAGHLVCVSAQEYALFEMDVIGTLGRERIVESGHRRESSRVGESAYYPGYRTLGAPRAEELEMRDAALHAVEDLVACVARGGAPRCSGRDGHEAVRLADAMIRSARTGTAIDVRSGT